MRRVQKIMNDWMFTKQGKKCPVDLPHTWNAVDGQDGGNDYFRGTCVYEKTFKKPEYNADECVYLQFQGVNASAKVILNGTEVCTHDNGYATFRNDVTELLKEENELRVEVDNSVNDRVYPQMADFTFYGGIYRDVELITVSSEHFDLDYYGGPGIKYVTEVNGKAAKVNVDTFTNVADLKEAGLEVEVILKDADGKMVASAKGTSVSLDIANVHLWDGVADPYLYQLTAQLKRGEVVVDEIGCNCGVRTFYIDPEKGFFLNGRSYPLHGVSRHQDWKGIGNAISYEHMDMDMDLIREVGANTVRLAHYQHNQYYYDLCDKYGMVVWAEIPYISRHLPNARANTFFQMRELIIQNYNHPCIMMWGLSNEITIKVTHKADMLDNHHKLQKLVKELDPTRPTTMANYACCGPFNRVTKISDIIAWNLYLGWYVPGLFLNDLFIKFYHFVYPKRALGYSEYGAEGMPNLHSEHPRRGDNTEEYQNIYHEYMLECFKRHPFMWGNYVWNMFDFAADARNQGGEPGMNHKGLVTFDRKTKKDSFYLYKAYWNKEDAFVYIAGRRFTYRRSAKQTITVYSNQKEVSLYQDGKLVETKKGENVFKFNVTLKDGENQFEAKAGKLTDSTMLCRTNETHPEYKVQKVDTKNWM
ncbi:MAG: glycoside hydrolase family 2 protein [Roseburia sp.]|nr:glycoside hydrolase family 2 protein [Roseburia sp.]